MLAWISSVLSEILTDNGKWQSDLGSIFPLVRTPCCSDRSGQWEPTTHNKRHTHNPSVGNKWEQTPSKVHTNRAKLKQVEAGARGPLATAAATVSKENICIQVGCECEDLK